MEKISSYLSGLFQGCECVGCRQHYCCVNYVQKKNSPLHAFCLGKQAAVQLFLVWEGNFFGGPNSCYRSTYWTLDQCFLHTRAHHRGLCSPIVPISPLKSLRRHSIPSKPLRHRQSRLIPFRQLRHIDAPNIILTPEPAPLDDQPVDIPFALLRAGKHSPPRGW